MPRAKNKRRYHGSVDTFQDRSNGSLAESAILGRQSKQAGDGRSGPRQESQRSTIGPSDNGNRSSSRARFTKQEETHSNSNRRKRKANSDLSDEPPAQRSRPDGQVDMMTQARIMQDLPLPRRGDYKQAPRILFDPNPLRALNDGLARLHPRFSTRNTMIKGMHQCHLTLQAQNDFHEVATGNGVTKVWIYAMASHATN